MPKVSTTFLARLKLHDLPAYRIAQLAGENPNTLSRLINGIDLVKPADPRIIAVGKVLGIAPMDCFEKSESQQGAAAHG